MSLLCSTYQNGLNHVYKEKYSRMCKRSMMADMKEIIPGCVENELSQCLCSFYPIERNGICVVFQSGDLVIIAEFALLNAYETFVFSSWQKYCWCSIFERKNWSFSFWRNARALVYILHACLVLINSCLSWVWNEGDFFGTGSRKKGFKIVWRDLNVRSYLARRLISLCSRFNTV